MRSRIETGLAAPVFSLSCGTRGGGGAGGGAGVATGAAAGSANHDDLAIGIKGNVHRLVSVGEIDRDQAIATAIGGVDVAVLENVEERPDLDQIYQTAHAMLTQRNGGWPLTMFLTPDQTPFYGGTYYPKHAHHGLPGFLVRDGAAVGYPEHLRITVGTPEQNARMLDALDRAVAG